MTWVVLMGENKSTRKFGLRISNWVFKEANIENAPNKSKRVEELILKGIWYEKEKALNTATKVSEASKGL